MMKRFSAFLATWVFCAGCGSYEPAQPPPSSPPAAQPSAAAPSSPEPVSSSAAPESPAVEDKTPANAAAAGAKEATAESAMQRRPGTELKKAQQGVGEKGHYEEGIITTPVSVFFSAQERIAFEIQIPHDMQIFKALENRPPKDQAEFMQKIIKANGIRLPELPPGHRYIYNPKTEQLMVEYPRPKASGGK
jgi:hypothetical protein